MRRPAPLPPPPAPPRPSEKSGEAAPGITVPADGQGTPALDDPWATAALTDDVRPPVALPGMQPGSPAEDAERVRMRDVWRAARARRKALRAEVRRFTARQRRRRIAWLSAAAAVATLVLATLGAAYSPLFAVETIRVVGVDRLDSDDVASSLDGQLGTPLPLVDESEVKAALVGFPVIETYSLEARPPHELVVRIVERLPVGLLPSRAGYTLVDAAGVALSTTETPADGYPVIDVSGTDTPAFEALGLVMRTLPSEIRDKVTKVSASTRDDVTFTLGDTGTKVVWGSAEDSAMKALLLEQTMKVSPPADTNVYDVSSPSAVVVR